MEKEKKLLGNMYFHTVIIIILAGILILSLLLAITFGSSNLTVSEVYKVLAYKLMGFSQFSEYGKGSVHDIVYYIRLPRLILAILVGSGLAVSGIVMQAVVKNALADPYILGISSGASLGATLSIILGVGSFLGSNYVGISAFLGAFLISIAVLVISGIGGKSNSTKLILSGMCLSSVCSAFSSFIIYITDDRNGLQSVAYWLMGSLAGAKWENIAILFPIIFILILFFSFHYKKLNLMLLGDEVAITLGTDLSSYRKIYLLLSSLAIGFIVYSSGIIGFVGLLVPHFSRIIFGTDHRKLIIPTALIGAIFVLWADVLARVILKSGELPIGVLISLIGAPTFMYLLIKKSYGFSSR